METIRDTTTICLFDVDGTLTSPRQKITTEMEETLQKLKAKFCVGLVGGSDAVKIAEQLGGSDDGVFQKYDYVFTENGLVSYKNGNIFSKMSIQEKLGEEKLQTFTNFVLRYLSDVVLPFKRGTFVEFRCGMINVSPVGRNCTIEERNKFEEYDKIHHVRKNFVDALKNKFPDLGLKFSVGGQISFDVFPIGWDKTYCLRHLEADAFKTIYFFGDKTAEGGNDYEIYNHPATKGHSVANPNETKQLLEKLFEL